jgi:phenylpropionate dioxygenase-like ring-hydroxylating dioxygenase large terminal subunit
MTGFLPDESDVHRRLKEVVEKDGSDNPPCHHRWSSTNYTSADAFAAESKLRAPICLGPAQRLLERNSYFLREVWGKSWIVRRTGNTQYAAHLNRCRHRGMKLVENESGNAGKIVCPYHGWTYDEQGVCVGVAQKAVAFPDLDMSAVRLESKRVDEHGSLLWLMDGGSAEFLAPLAAHFTSWNLSGCALHSVRQQTVRANWKLLVEAFLEDYHVPFVHRKTLAPATLSFKWLTDVYELHGRAVYPLQRLKSDLNLKKLPLRRYISVVYHIFPNTLVSFQPFHALVTNFVPLAPDLTRAIVSILTREEDVQEFAPMVDKDIEFVAKGLLEDFTTTEKIQEGFTSGPVDFIAGNFEGQIERFHKSLEKSQ